MPDEVANLYRKALAVATVLAGPAQDLREPQWNG
jgi:hypothetical protein